MNGLFADKPLGRSLTQSGHRGIAKAALQ